MTVSDAATASVCTVLSDAAVPSSHGRISAAKAGSPSQPSVSDASVMPSWLADRYAGSWAVMPSSSRARTRPSRASCWSRVGRILTNANSAATKNAFARTITPVRSKATDGCMAGEDRM